MPGSLFLCCAHQYRGWCAIVCCLSSQQLYVAAGVRQRDPGCAGFRLMADILAATDSEHWLNRRGRTNGQVLTRRIRPGGGGEVGERARQLLTADHVEDKSTPARSQMTRPSDAEINTGPLTTFDDKRSTLRAHCDWKHNSVGHERCAPVRVSNLRGTTILYTTFWRRYSGRLATR